MKIDVDNDTVTHMLGYLSARKWADAIENYPELDHNLIQKLVKSQTEAYGFDLKVAIEEEFKNVG